MAKDWRAEKKEPAVKVTPPEGPVSPETRAFSREAAPVEEALGADRVERQPEVPRPRRIAILAIHGMGQQIPFETIDQVQGNFCAAAHRQGVELPRPSATVDQIGDQTLRRAELLVGDGEVHFYEAYWAPLTEGRIDLRDVISFLRMGGSNGLQSSLKASSWRYMFQKRFPFPRSIPNVLYLSLALLAVSSLVVLNTIVLAVAAATNWLPLPTWLASQKALQDDLTGVASLVCLVGTTLGACLLLAITRRGLAGGRPWRLSGLQRFAIDTLFYLTLIVLILSALMMVWLVKQHAELSSYHQSFSILNLVLGGDTQAFQLATVVTGSIFAIALIAVLVLLAKLIFYKWLGRWLAPVARMTATLGFFLVLAVFVAAGLYLLALLREDHALSSLSGLWKPLPWIFESRRIWIWTALIGLSAFARSFLIQYLGDVALYVSPHKLDRFNEIRERIRKTVFDTAGAIYSDRPDGTFTYDHVVVVAHSLGSVIAYDTLNFLIKQDILAGGTTQVAERTRLLLTFGSPLDKIAYLFQVQGTRTSDMREALANAVQPLIQDYKYRTFKWINVFSKNDIIAGSLEFFDDGSGNSQSVDNQEDPYSSIPLAAHTEYWQTSLVWDNLYAEVVALLR